MRQYERAKKAPPTDSLNTLEGWSADFSWQDRAKEFDADEEEDLNEARRRVMQTGLALDFERVDELKALARFLRAAINEKGKPGLDGSPPQHHNVFVPDVRQMRNGEEFVIVDVERYNSAIIGDYLRVLDDLAKETGGRKIKQELTGKDGGPIDFSDATASLERKLAALAARVGAASVSGESDAAGSQST